MLIKCNLCKKNMELSENLTIPQLKTQQYIQKGLGYETTSAGYVIVDALVQKQYLAKANYKKRSLIVLKEVPCEIS